MAGLELILKKLDQISNRLDLLEKKIEQRDQTVPAPSVSQQNPQDWKISSELLNQKKATQTGKRTSMITSSVIKMMSIPFRGVSGVIRTMSRN